jgi:hypothetical protein
MESYPEDSLDTLSLYWLQDVQDRVAMHIGASPLFHADARSTQVLTFISDMEPFPTNVDRKCHAAPIQENTKLTSGS